VLVQERAKRGLGYIASKRGANEITEGVERRNKRPRKSGVSFRAGTSTIQAMNNIVSVIVRSKHSSTVFRVG
jgi:hypothetical protein